MSFVEQLAHPRDEDFRRAFAAFNEYLVAMSKLNDAMATLGVPTRNVDPLANFAEVIVAKELNGVIQPAANKGFDVVAPDGTKVQVKSLRVSSGRKGDNWLTWNGCTRSKGLAAEPLIDAEWLAIVVYLDSRPHSLLWYRIVDADCFPIAKVKNLYFRHVESLLQTSEQHDAQVLRVLRLHQEAST